MNHKRVLRMMREDNLLAVQPNGSIVVTTDSKHSLEMWLKSGAAAESERDQPTVGGRYHLHPTAGGSLFFWR